MSWPEKRMQSTCPSCGGLLLASEGKGPIYAWARPVKGSPPRWEHHRQPPEGFDLTTARRLECAACGRAILLGEAVVKKAPS